MKKKLVFKKSDIENLNKSIDDRENKIIKVLEKQREKEVNRANTVKDFHKSMVDPLFFAKGGTIEKSNDVKKPFNKIIDDMRENFEKRFEQ